MFTDLPKRAVDVMDWTWSKFEPYAKDLESRELNVGNIDAFLRDWSRMQELLYEVGNRLEVATTLDTTSEEANSRYMGFLDNTLSPALEVDNRLKKKLLASGLKPEGFDIPLRNMQSEADLFREENIALQNEHTKVSLNYAQIIGTQSLEWQGKEITLTELSVLVKDSDRTTREQAWRLASKRVLQDREQINANWVKLIEIRRQIAKNAGKKDYREYTWQEKLRFDYTPENAFEFHLAIAQEVTPALTRIYERRLQRMGVATLRPWDVSVDVMRNADFTGDGTKHAPITPFKDMAELEAKGQAVFDAVDPKLGEYFAIMRDEGLLDLPNYPGKAPGAYCTSYTSIHRPFVFMNAAGTAGDVNTLLHEIGHAFHVFESAPLPYLAQRDYGSEIAEVASMAMELLGGPYTRGPGAFFSDQEYARFTIMALEEILSYWAYMAVVDAFNHWANTDPKGIEPAACDAKWGELWDRFMVGQDWSSLEDEKVTGWHRKLHIHQFPFYYIEYGLARLGAVQVWRNALKDQAKAVADYRKALSLGGSRPLPELFAAAGAKFAFDAATMHDAVDLVESTILRLEGELASA